MIIENAEEHFADLGKLTSYSYVKFLRSSWPKSQKVVTVPKKCYLIDKDSQKRPRFICKSGFLTRICRYFKGQNVEYEIFDTIDPDSETFTVDWEFLEQVPYRPHQRECIETIIRNRSGLIQAATGLGKTFLIGVLARAWTKAKITIITRSREVLQGIVRECEKYGTECGIITGGVYEPKRITACTAASLHKCEFDADIVLADECHELVTPQTLPHLYRFSNARMFGFSATINTRADNAHFHLYEIFGEIIYKVPFIEAVKHDLIVPIAVQWIPVIEGPVSGDLDSVRFKKQAIWRNTARNQIIARVAQQHYNEGRQVLILVETVDHAINLKQFLPDFKVCAAAMDINQYELYKRRGFEIDQIKESIAQRDLLKDLFKTRQLRGAIATNIWSAGVSFEDLEVLVRADARVSKTVNIQAPGRVCRIPTSVDKQFGLVIDFHDKFDKRMEIRSRKRFAAYKQMGWLQCDENWNVLKSLPD